MSLGKAWT